MTHDQALMLASAVADGEAATSTGLDAHLASCASCASYADGLAGLSALTAALPREAAPANMPGRVTRAIRGATRRRRAIRLVPALAAATGVAVALAVLPGPASFGVPPAGAAEPLLRLRSLYVERTVDEGFGTVVTERIWWRAPGSVRIERGGNVEIRTPGAEYAGGLLTTGMPPETALPEPLSPTVALLGRDTGPGPSIAGRPTRRYELSLAGDRRVAYVDASFVLGADEQLVLMKQGSGPVVKRVTEVRVDEPMPDSLFTPPPNVATTDAGFRERRLGSLAVDPDRRPEGFRVVTAGRGPGGDVVLFARGSLPVLVRTGVLTTSGRTEVRTVGGRLVAVDLHGPPAVQVRGLVVSAPLPLDSLVALADEMYPAE